MTMQKPAVQKKGKALHVRTCWSRRSCWAKRQLCSFQVVVERRQHPAGQGHGEGGDDPVGAVPHEQGHPGAFRHAAADERPCLYARPGQQLPVGETYDPLLAVEGDGLPLRVAGCGLLQQSTHGERADAGLGLRRRAHEGGHAGSSTSTGPLASTEPSWLVMTTSTVTIPAPNVVSSRLAVTSPSSRGTSPSKGGKRYWTAVWRMYPRSPAHA